MRLSASQNSPSVSDRKKSCLIVVYTGYDWDTRHSGLKSLMVVADVAVVPLRWVKQLYSSPKRYHPSPIGRTEIAKEAPDNTTSVEAPESYIVRDPDDNILISSCENWKPLFESAVSRASESGTDMHARPQPKNDVNPRMKVSPEAGLQIGEDSGNVGLSQSVGKYGQSPLKFPSIRRVWTSGHLGCN
jgi:hypothetical protein